MRILLIGDLTGQLDEGMKKTTHHLGRHLAQQHEVQVVHPRSLLNLKGIQQAVRFEPDIVHYIHGPTIRSFLLTKGLSFCLQQSITIMSAPRPMLSRTSEHLIPFLNPDLMLVQSSHERERFERLGCKVSFLPGGVLLEKFKPVSLEQKLVLRQRYGFLAIPPIILHVGHITEDRGVALLGKIRERLDRAADFIIIGATTMRPEDEIIRSLEGSGCKVLVGYVERIEEFYQMADCYVFPGMGKSPAIEIPLTVLEALACNLPVVSSPFGGLPELFKDRVDGLSFATTVDSFVYEIQQYTDGSKKVLNTRKMVEPLSWASVAKKLLDTYDELITNAAR